jgi:hypothetical protein
MSEVSTAWNQQFEGEVAETTRVNAVKLLINSKIRKDSPKLKEVFVELDDENKINVATTFAQTVEKLTIKAKESKLGVSDEIQFPQLKVLDLQIDSLETLMNQCRWIVGINAEQIEEVKLSIPAFEEYDDEDIQYFHEDLARKIGTMKSLKVLDLSDCVFDDVFHMWENVEFCLPNLEVLKTDDVNLFDNFKKSLKTAIVAGEISDLKIAKFLSKFEQLETLDLEYRLWYKPKRVQGFEVNKKIKNLWLKFTISDFKRAAFNDHLKKLLAALPDLETLYVDKLSKEVMEFIAANNRKLKQLKFREIECGTKEKFEKMRRQGQKEVNLDMQLVQEIYE